MNCRLFKLERTKLFAWLQLAGRGSGRKQSSHLFALFDQLHNAGLDLKEASSGLEAQFLATSSALESLAGFGNRFVKHVEKLVGLATGKECDGSIFVNAFHLIEQATRFLIGCQEQTAQKLEMLRNYNTQIKQLLGMEAELQRTMLPLKFVQTLFKSESAPLGPAVQQMFGALTQEMEGLHSQVREIFGTKFKQLEQTGQTISLVMEQLERQAQSLQQATMVQRAQIESTLEILRKEMIANQERDAHLSRLSRDLAREVEQIVIGLQFQDIINQKLEHVMAALPHIETRFAEFKAAPSGAARAESLHFLVQSCRLEAGQLQAAQDELAEAERSIHSGVEKVINQLTKVDSQCLSLSEFKMLTTSFDGMVQVLVETIEEVRDLVAATVASATEAYERLQPLGSLASGLTAIVREMSARIHLIGLNAQVQSAHTAQDRRGTGLGVLSARTSEIAEETARISQLAAEQLDLLAAGLAESVSAFGRLRADALTQQTMLNEQGATEEQQLHAIRDSALETLREIGNSLDEIRNQAGRTLATVQFNNFHQVTLPALREPLTAIADTAEQLFRTPYRNVKHGSLVDSFQGSYTMASERKIFASVVSGNRLPSPSLSDAGRPAENPETELFDHLATDPEGELSLPVDQKLEAAVVAPAPGSPAAGDLGANVELF